MPRYCYILIFIVGLLAGCASTSTPLLTSSRYHRVGVVSLMGYEVQAKSVGWWAFANKSWMGDVRDWEMNDYTHKEMVDSLRRRGFEAVALSYDPIKWSDRFQKKNRGGMSGLFSAYGGDVVTPEFRQEFTEAVTKENLDAIMVFVPGRDTTTQTGEGWIDVGDTGMGFRAVGKNAIEPYVMGVFYLIDGTSLKTVARARMQSMGSGLQVSFPPNWAGYPVSERAALEAAIRKLFLDELEPTLGRL